MNYHQNVLYTITSKDSKIYYNGQVSTDPYTDILESDIGYACFINYGSYVCMYMYI